MDGVDGLSAISGSLANNGLHTLYRTGTNDKPDFLMISCLRCLDFFRSVNSNTWLLYLDKNRLSLAVMRTSECFRLFMANSMMDWVKCLLPQDKIAFAMSRWLDVSELINSKTGNDNWTDRLIYEKTAGTCVCLVCKIPTDRTAGVCCCKREENRAMASDCKGICKEGNIDLLCSQFPGLELESHCALLEKPVCWDAIVMFCLERKSKTR